LRLSNALLDFYINPSVSEWIKAASYHILSSEWALSLKKTKEKRKKREINYNFL